MPLRTKMPLHPRDGRKQSAYAIYDASTGEVIHVHHRIVMPGAKSPAENEIREQAMTLVSQTTNRSPSELSLLPIKAGQLRPGHRYSVDLSSGQLHETAILVDGRPD
jgi:hypothetical protein